MKALVGKSQVVEHIGPAMSDLMLKDVNKEHNDTQVLTKCGGRFTDEIRCCRVLGHLGVCFARNWDGSLTRMVITHVWDWS
jgi:hypothetical protein